MLFIRSRERETHYYGLAEASAFMGFDAKAVEYWLRMGHLPGSWDEKSGDWKIRPQALVEFLHEAGEPMPTGDIHSCSLNKRVGAERVPAA